MNENYYQAKLIKKIQVLFPGCIVLKNDAKYKQGICDLTILYKGTGSLLEVKKSAKARHRPNQDYWVNYYNSQKGFASFIYPENEERVLSDMRAFVNTLIRDNIDNGRIN